MDDEVSGVMERMSAISHDSLQGKLIPLLRALDEDTLVSHYAVADQARLYLSLAFLLASATYSLDRLNNRKSIVSDATAASAVAQASSAQSRASRLVQQHLESTQMSTSVFDTAASLKAGGDTATAARAQVVDMQVLLKIERITGYIRKIKEINEIERSTQAAAAAKTETAATTHETTSGTAGPQVGRKRTRAEAGVDSAPTSSAADGDAAMFSVLQNARSKIDKATARRLATRAEAGAQSAPSPDAV